MDFILEYHALCESSLVLLYLLWTHNDYDEKEKNVNDGLVEEQSAARWIR